MSDTSILARELTARAARARKEGRPADAVSAAQEAVAVDPQSAPAWNMLGLLQMETGDPKAAAASFRLALSHDPQPPAVWYNLACSLGICGEFAAQLESLEEVLSRDNFFLPAILSKGVVLKKLGRGEEAYQLCKSVLAGVGDDAAFPPSVRAQIHEAREIVRTFGGARHRHYDAVLAEVASAYPQVDLSRVRGFAEQRAGQRKVYVQQPTAGHFPYLPAIEFFDRALFPWFENLEAGTAEIRAELLSLLVDEDPNFRPYVTYAPGTPLNQWEELNHSPRWSAWFLWENGQRNHANCARCPRTAAIVEALPMLDMPGKAPTVMFSILRPETKIPPHTGSTNVRTTVHLPLIVPEGCGFRVGAETRTWREGEAWAFDDTIEHEAWNDSAKPRAILILDAWNPLLSEAERAAVRLVG
ncbi:aspartyl/asparaginyl beta-hydroxylase domain-containing protein [Sphingomonas sp. LY54]|uniref:aspartyl/asparaginyl beta-hydroxylase domain-containing protein n=1 Tax=Sphingomonas sp. LY54 TaxID=3095343 RepID=UPI002D794F37|nr:aspartyl/asparaginyl beta-hydroxylase domain-containing protein [Sphingomonas sp. LY54]WRP27652.1 aspartyl/asparaginyl beta-hydroxylase domain-containing protein [Sphingomonas sp. LY54]